MDIEWKIICVLLELVPLTGEKCFEQHPQNRILIPRVFFSKFQTITPILLNGCPPGSSTPQSSSGYYDASFNASSFYYR